MKRRAFVLIFFMWAVITIITPTLVIWSTPAKPSTTTANNPARSAGGKIRDRRLLTGHYLERNGSEPMAPAPSPSPSPCDGLNITSNHRDGNYLQ
ncbi:hypothetical protein Syun_005082 [Stephania yunnanensis]|uniref:Uncharacterized protein n=1 Tax=Stephania yunnanensis TaxID=152371 RepID=A0AAP0L539_9MAGN